MVLGALEYVALGMIVFVALVLFYGVIAIHDIPYEIAKKRNHPHSEAIHYAGWVSMFTLHAIWPFLWIWATIYHADRGYGFSDGGANTQKLLDRLEGLEQRLAEFETAKPKGKKKPAASQTPATPEPEPSEPEPAKSEGA
jgi:hypothetical protein